MAQEGLVCVWFHTVYGLNEFQLKENNTHMLKSLVWLRKNCSSFFLLCCDDNLKCIYLTFNTTVDAIDLLSQEPFATEP